VRGFLLLGKLAGHMLAYTHLNAKESELFRCYHLEISPDVSIASTLDEERGGSSLKPGHLGWAEMTGRSCPA